MKNVKIKPLDWGREYTTRIVAAFGDISGFGKWFDSLSDQELELKPFMREVDELIDEFEDQPQYFVKREGDGFLVVMELHEGENGKEIAQLLVRLLNMQLRMERLIHLKPYPRPDGFRVRVTSGYAWRRFHRGKIDYLAKSINLASKLLRVGKNVPFIIHESVKDFIPKGVIKKYVFKFKKMVVGNDYPEGVYQKDMDSLWSIDMKFGHEPHIRHNSSDSSKLPKRDIHPSGDKN